MHKITIGLVGMLLVIAPDAVDAQSISGRVSGAVGAVGSVGGEATSQFGGAANPYGALNHPIAGSAAGGELPGGFGMKIGDKVIRLRGAVGVGDDRDNFKAGAGIPF